MSGDCYGRGVLFTAGCCLRLQQIYLLRDEPFSSMDLANMILYYYYYIYINLNYPCISYTVRLGLAGASATPLPVNSAGPVCAGGGIAMAGPT